MLIDGWNQKEESFAFEHIEIVSMPLKAHGYRPCRPGMPEARDARGHEGQGILAGGPGIGHQGESYSS
eukprot:1726206-Karenia_brevis.AAC.1